VPLQVPRSLAQCWMDMDNYERIFTLEKERASKHSRDLYRLLSARYRFDSCRGDQR